MKKNTVVLGLGNVLMSDEGVGVRVVEKLSAESEKYPHVDFIDAGTGGMSVLHRICGKEKVIIIDCAQMGTTAGTIKRFTPEQVESVKTLRHYSLHEADILRVIDLAKQIDSSAREAVVFGIEPESVSPGRELSETLACRIDSYAAAVRGELSA